MRFTPKTEKEVAEAGLLPPGTYDFEVAGAKDATSKAQNEMIVLTLKVYDPDGNYRLVNDYLLESIPHKLRHVAYACGLGERYEAGELTADDFLDRTGQLKLAIKKDKAGQYPDQNSVRDYVVADGEAVPQPADRSVAAPLDDEIPFAWAGLLACTTAAGLAAMQYLGSVPTFIYG